MVEDSPSDVFLARQAIQQTNLLNNLHVVDDGVEAMAFLRKEEQYLSAPRPDLVLLDWNLPRKSGREVLAEIKADENLKRIPVVILSSSKAEVDVNGAYSLHANCYVAKPIGFPNFVDVMSQISHFWFSMVTLPTH
jgi:two-component system response regulator